MNFFVIFAVVFGFASGFNGYSNVSTGVTKMNENFDVCPAPEFELEMPRFEEYEGLFEKFLLIELEYVPIDEEECRTIDKTDESVAVVVSEVVAPEVVLVNSSEVAPKEPDYETAPEVVRIIGFVAQLVILFVAISLLSIEIDETADSTDRTPVFKLYVAEEVKPMSLKCRPRSVNYIGQKNIEKPCTSDC